MPAITIVGLRERSAGKTTLARALISYLRENGISVCGFKPRAANNVWYDFDVVWEGLSNGRLYGIDAKLLREESRTDFPEEVINPVHRLWDEPYAGTLSFIVERISFGDERRNVILLNSNLAAEYDEMIERLRSRAWMVIDIREIDELNRAVQKYHPRAIEDAYGKLSMKYEFLVVEGYSNVASPYDGISADLVLAIGPKIIEAYDGRKFTQAIEFCRGIRTEPTTDQVRELIKPIAKVEIHPMRSSEVIKGLREKLETLVSIR